MSKNYIQVEDIYFGNLTNAEFISFMERFMALLPLEDDEEGGKHAPKLAVSAALVNEGNAFLATMHDLTRKSQLKAETKPKKELDRMRGRILAYVIERLDFSRDALEADVAAAAEKLFIVAKPYRGAGRLAYNQATEMIRGFLQDMNKSENQYAVTTLGIRGDLDTLESYNNQFDALVKEADMERSALGFDETMIDLRVQMGEWYTEVTSLAFSSNVLNESEESLYFMNGLNALIADVKKLYKQRIAQLRSNKGEDEAAAAGGDGSEPADEATL